VGVVSIEGSLARLRRVPWRRLGRALLIIALAIAASRVAVPAYVNLQTSVWWFDSLGHGRVYTTMLVTQVVLFVVFALLAGGAAAGALLAFHRHRPDFQPDYQTQIYRHWLVRYEPYVRKLVFWLVVALLALRAGSAAVSLWQPALLWLHARPWGVSDGVLHHDISTYVSVLPFWRAAATQLRTLLIWALIIPLVLAYPLGAVRLRPRPWASRALIGQLSVTGAALLLVQALRYWLARSTVLTTEGGPVTGAGYTDQHVLLPGLGVASVVCVVAAAALVVGAARRSWRLPLGTLVVLAVCLGLALSIVPTAVLTLREQPSEQSLDLAEIGRNQQATLAAFGLAGRVHTEQFGSSTLSGSALTSQAARNAQLRILDPNAVAPTFTVKQQIEAYYGFKQTLDIDHYTIDGKSRDVVIGARELNRGALPRSSWEAQHLIYTHGYGVVAALTDQVDAGTGVPAFVNGGLPAKNAIEVSEPRIYFGQSEPTYSVVGRADDGAAVEFDYPSNDGAGATTTYDGAAGARLGSWWRRGVYALKLGSKELLFSGAIDADSRVLAVRDPRQRVARLAPWLTLDGDVYPVVVDGRVQWVVDAYTTSGTYPESQQVNLAGATSTTLTDQGASVNQPNRSVNHLRISVKAVVDAYTGAVRGQATQPDPVLQEWERAFPGLVQPESALPQGLVGHLRYPSDLFNVQRSLLARYHVSNARAFYAGSGYWKVPSDPTVAASNQLNSGSSSSSVPTLPSTYMTVSRDGTGKARYALSSPMVTLNQRNLAALVSVDAEPGPTYGQFTVLEMPAGAAVASPAQVQNDIEATSKIARALTLERGGNSSVLVGNLLAVPLGGRVLYVEPVYTLAAGPGTFPVLRHVIAVYGTGDPAFEPTLDAAVARALADPGR